MLIKLIFMLGILHPHSRIYTDCQNVSRWNLRKTSNSQAKTEENKHKFLMQHCKIVIISTFFLFKTSRLALWCYWHGSTQSPEIYINQKSYAPTLKRNTPWVTVTWPHVWTEERVFLLLVKFSYTFCRLRFRHTRTKYIANILLSLNREV